MNYHLTVILVFAGITAPCLGSVIPPGGDGISFQGDSLPIADTNYFPLVDGLHDAGSYSNQIAAENTLTECRAIEGDPSGGWGEEAMGFRLFIRFGSEFITNGQPVVARVIARNVSDQQRMLHMTDRSEVFRDSYLDNFRFSVIGPDGTPQAAKSREFHRIQYLQVPTSTQRKFEIPLDREFAFSSQGEYRISVMIRFIDPLDPQKRIELHSREAVLRIINPAP